MIYDQLKIQPERHRSIAIVGAGGKTSLIYTLAEEFRQLHKKVLITTTTHMFRPQEHFLPAFEEVSIRKALEAHGIVTVGIPCESGKIKGIEPFELEKIRTLCDVVLIEADGAHRKPMKVPASYEPILPQQVDLVIGMLGAYAIGKPLEETCHRFELAEKILGVEKNHIVTLADLEYLLQSEQGQKKGVNQEYRPVIGQADHMIAADRISDGITAIILKNKGLRRGE